MNESGTSCTTFFFKEALSTLCIDSKRKELLENIAHFIGSELQAGRQVNINFICTHNSRRSQLSQVWSHFATEHFSLRNIQSFSGGTAVTAFHRNTVKTLQEKGFIFEIANSSIENPVYTINYTGCIKPINGFSKRYDSLHNQYPFIAITTCSEADSNCPFIAEAIQRFHLPFKDPKSSDGTPIQAESYLAANRQISGEIHYLFKFLSDNYPF